jgi:cytochrome d ubiquinol oxidase subunit II
MLLGKRLRLSDWAPFAWSLALLFFACLAMSASLYPYVVPPTMTVAEAAAPPLILTVMLAVMVLVLPLMLIYNAYQYLVFRGKVSGGGYGAYED